MAPSRIFVVAALTLAAAACVPSMTRGANGWHESGLDYAIEPLADGKPFPAGWTVEGYEPMKDGYVRDDEGALEGVDYALDRREDDGALVLKTYPLDNDDAEKLPEVLAERWIDRVLTNPQDESELRPFRKAIPSLTATARARVGFGSIESRMLLGRDVRVDQRRHFAPPGGEAVELTLTLAAHDGPPDRRVYLVLARHVDSGRYTVLVYGNTVSMFDAGLPDATSLAHRLHF